MRTVLSIATVFLFTLLAAHAADPAETDLEQLRILFDADQDIRSEENRKAGNFPTLQEERDRRFTVFQLISENKLRNANDYYHAGMIIHHTGSIQLDSGEIVSLGTESKLLAFFLFRSASKLGHKSGRPMMGTAYNYYLRACGEDSGKYGFRFEGYDVIWRPNVDGEDKDTLKCGFDPRPYLE